jgi:hypothetical protein
MNDIKNDPKKILQVSKDELTTEMCLMAINVEIKSIKQISIKHPYKYLDSNSQINYIVGKILKIMPKKLIHSN